MSYRIKVVSCLTELKWYHLENLRTIGDILESKLCILRTNCYGPLKSNYEMKSKKSMKLKPKNII